MVVRNAVSCFFVSSRQTVIRRSPRRSASSFNVFTSRCGASYITIVLVSVSSSVSTASRSFLSGGRNASNAKRLVPSPDIVNAVTHAAGPGTELTLTPAS